MEDVEIKSEYDEKLKLFAKINCRKIIVLAPDLIKGMEAIWAFKEGKGPERLHFVCPNKKNIIEVPRHAMGFVIYNLNSFPDFSWGKILVCYEFSRKTLFHLRKNEIIIPNLVIEHMLRPSENVKVFLTRENGLIVASHIRFGSRTEKKISL